MSTPRCPVDGLASSTLPVVDALFVAACGVAGAAVGALLDPVGQVLADRSRTAEELDRVERDVLRAVREVARNGGDPDSGAAMWSDPRPLPIPEFDTELPIAVPELLTNAPPTETATETGDPATSGVRHLLPSGHAPVRTLGSAVATGALWAAVARSFGPYLLVIPYLAFMALAVAVAVTDLTHRLVPRRLIYAALVPIAVGLLGVSIHDQSWHKFVIAVIGGAMAFGVFFLIWFFVPRGMGFGDVRLAGVIGLTVGYLGLVHVYLAFLAGFVLGLLFGIVLMFGSTAGRKTRIPFAPALVAGAAIAILWGGTIGQHLFHSGS
jgi:leader peptidase (prepilin peptidase)/N-methyltransferase